MADLPKSKVTKAIDDAARAIDEREIDDLTRGLSTTKTSMTTDSPPIEQRPIAPPKYPEIRKTLDVFQLAGHRHNPEKEVRAASQIWSHCGIWFDPIFHPPYYENDTKKLIGNELTVFVKDDKRRQSLENLRQEWRTKRKGELAAFFAPKVFLATNGAPSTVDPDYKIAYMGKDPVRHPTGWVLAHELGHLLIGNKVPHHALRSSLMRLRGSVIRGNKIVDLECRAARGDLKAQFELYRRS